MQKEAVVFSNPVVQNSVVFVPFIPIYLIMTLGVKTLIEQVGNDKRRKAKIFQKKEGSLSRSYSFLLFSFRLYLKLNLGHLYRILK